MTPIKVLLADDEPFIIKGMKVLIDWEAYGCEIVKTCNNGKDAYEYLKKEKVDLAVLDIRMPQYTGLEVISKLREDGINDVDFVILSGYGDFSYAQQAVRLSVTDYLLKPVQAKQLIDVIKKISDRKNNDDADSEGINVAKRAQLVQYLVSIIYGKSNSQQADFVERNLNLHGNINYIHITLDNVARLEEMTDEEVREIKNKMFNNCSEFLAEDSDHLFPEASGVEEEYELGFIFCDELSQKRGISDTDFLEEFRKAAVSDIPTDVFFLVGKSVAETAKLSHSYSSACALRYFRNFRKGKNIYYYDKDMHVSHTQAKSNIHKDIVDELILAVSRHDEEGITSCVDKLFENMESIQFNDKMLNLNMNYLIFRMINLAVEIDETVEQDSILLNISDDVFVPGKDFRDHLKNFVMEYSDYLEQLRENTGRDRLIDIENDIKEHYADNLTLRALGNKYFINCSYLGQLFRKKYGMSFKDYLNNFRINQASDLLLKSDRKVADIAAEVGYKDTDYFVAKFIEIKGCTPTKYRRSIQPDEN